MFEDDSNDQPEPQLKGRPIKVSKTGKWHVQIYPAENGYLMSVVEVGMTKPVEFVYPLLSDLLDQVMARFGIEELH